MYSPEIYEEEAKEQLSYHEKQDYSLHAPRFDMLLKWTGNVEHFHSLDVGCGWGYFMELVQFQYPGMWVEGVDISPTKVNYGRLKGLHITLGDVREWEPESRWPFDLVYCSEFLEHFDYPVEMAKRVAVWGKHIIFTTPIYSKDEERVSGLHLSYVPMETHQEIALLVGKMLKSEIVQSPTSGISWACSLVKVGS